MPPKLAEAFRLLRRGKHICRDDVQVYRDLKENKDRYLSIFQALGYELEHHPQDFFYLTGESVLKTKALQAAALFVLILFQDLEEKKFQTEMRQWQKTLTTRIFRLADMPHFATTERRRMMTTIGVDQNGMKDVLRTLKQIGMLEWIESDKFQFRSPVYRFVDLCMQMAEREGATIDKLTEADAPLHQEIQES